MLRNTLLLCLSFTLLSGSANARTFIGQTQVRTSPGSQDASSQFEINSTTKGLLVPRLTTTQKNNIVSPANGLIVFDTTLGLLNFYSSGWNSVPSATSSNDSRNRIINGAMDIWNSGTSFTSVANGTYTAEMFVYNTAGTSAVHTLARSTDVPTLAESGFQSSYSLHADVTTADAAVAAGDAAGIAYRMEGYDYTQIKGRTVTLSFWVKDDKTGTHCVAFRNNGGGTPDRSYVAEYSISAGDTWEKKNITITLDPSGGTDNFTNGIGLIIQFTLIAGSTFQTTAGSWQTGNYTGTSNCVNSVDDVNNDFKIAQVMLNPGSTAEAFTRAGLTIGGDRVLSQRYFEKSYDPDTTPGTATYVGAIAFVCGDSGQSISIPVQFKVTKANTPTFTYYAPGTGTASRITDSTAGDVTGRIYNAVAVGLNSTGVETLAACTATRYYSIHWTSNARL